MNEPHNIGQKIFDGVDFRRLGQVPVEAGFFGACAVIGSPPTCQRNQRRFFQPRHLPQSLGDFVTIHARQSDIQKDDMGTEFSSRLQRLMAIVRNEGYVPEKIQQGGHRICRVDIVVDNKNSQADGARACVNARGLHFGGFLLSGVKRQLNNESASLTGAWTAARDRAAVQAKQPSCEP